MSSLVSEQSWAREGTKQNTCRRDMYITLPLCLQLRQLSRVNHPNIVKLYGSCHNPVSYCYYLLSLNSPLKVWVSAVTWLSDHFLSYSGLPCHGIRRRWLIIQRWVCMWYYRKILLCYWWQHLGSTVLELKRTQPRTAMRSSPVQSTLPLSARSAPYQLLYKRVIAQRHAARSCLSQREISSQPSKLLSVTDSCKNVANWSF